MVWCMMMTLSLPAPLRAQERPKEPISIKALKDYYKTQEIDSCLQPYHDASVDQIILIRHGEPDILKTGWRNRKEAIQFMQLYDSVGVLTFSKLPVCPQDVLEDPVFYSNIPRAVKTAELIFADRSDMIVDGRFREFERKVMPFFNIKMPLNFWLVGSRVLWMLGFNDKGIETYKEARQRARGNARFLAEHTAQTHLIVVVAHGMLNRYMAKYLKKMGWSQVRKGGSSYTAVNILAKQAAQNPSVISNP